MGIRYFLDCRNVGWMLHQESSSDVGKANERALLSIKASQSEPHVPALKKADLERRTAVLAV